MVTAGDSGSGGQPRLQWRLLTHPHVALDGQRRPPRPTRTFPPRPHDDRRTALPRCGQMKDELWCLRVSINPPPFVVTTPLRPDTFAHSGRTISSERGDNGHLLAAADIQAAITAYNPPRQAKKAYQSPRRRRMIGHESPTVPGHTSGAGGPWNHFLFSTAASVQTPSQLFASHAI